MKIMGMLGVVVVTAASLAACSDDDPAGTAGTSGKSGSSGKGGGSGSSGSGGTAGASGSAATGGTAGADAGTGGTAGSAGTAGADGGPREFSGVVPLSDTQNDRVFAVAFGPGNKLYLAGFVDQPRAGVADTKFAVGRFNSDGSRDTSFGTNGVASHDVIRGTAAGAAAGAETARGVVVQSDGKVVLVGNAERNADGADAAAQDMDVVAVRFTTSGALDTGFGENGVRRIDLGPGGASVRDQAWGVALAGQDQLIVFASRKAADPRTDRDRVVVRLTANGAIDTAFATGGYYTLDADGLNLPDELRNGIVEPGGKIVWAGYTPVGTPTANNQIVLLRLNADGSPDNTFGGDGHINVAPLAAPGMTEAYGVARQSDGKYVTTGYGRAEAAPATVNLVSARFTADGALDTTWSNNDTVFQHDVSGFDDRGRNLLALPDNRVVMVGTGKRTASNEDAMVLVLTAGGVLDTSFDQDGVKFYDFGRTADEEFFGVALSTDNKLVAAAGYTQDAAVDGGVVKNDDATLLVFPVGN